MFESCPKSRFVKCPALLVSPASVVVAELWCFGWINLVNQLILKLFFIVAVDLLESVCRLGFIVIFSGYFCRRWIDFLGVGSNLSICFVFVWTFCLARPTFWSFSSGSDVRILSRKLLAFQVVSMEVISVGWYLGVFGFFNRSVRLTLFFACWWWLSKCRR